METLTPSRALTLILVLASASFSIQSVSINTKVPSLTDDTAIVLTPNDSPQPTDFPKVLNRRSRNLGGPEVTRLHIRTNVRNRFAKTRVTSTVFNDDANAAEVIFQFMVPEKAFITGFSMDIQGKIYKGEVLPKNQARKEYGEAVNAEKTAAHLKPTARESSLFDVSVHLEPSATITFNLTYEELLTRQSGLYDVTIHLVTCNTVILDMSAEVFIKEPHKITTVHVPEPAMYHKNGTLAQGRFVKIDKISENKVHITYNPTQVEQQEILTYVANEGTLEGTQKEESASQRLRVQYDVEHPVQDIALHEGYFVQFFALNESDADLLKKHVIFVLDVSGSMSGDKIQQLKDAMQRILDTLNKNKDYFTIITFSSGNTVYKSSNHGIHQVTPGSIQDVKQYIHGLNAGGETNIKDALGLGLDTAAKGKNNNNVYMTQSQTAPPEQIIIFLTDGQGTDGSPDEVIEHVKSKNSKMKVPIFSLAFGDKAKFEFLKKLSLQNYAAAKKIYTAADADLQLETFFRKVGTPLLTDLNFQYTNPNVIQNSVTKSKFHTYYSGREIVILGKLRKKVSSVSMLGAHITHSKNTSSLPSSPKQNQSSPDPKGRVTRDTHESDDIQLDRMWGFITMQQKLEEIIASKNESGVSGKAINETEDNLQKMVNVALEYGYVTPVTPLIVEKPSYGSDQHPVSVVIPKIEGIPEMELPVNFTLTEGHGDVDYYQGSSAAFPPVPHSGMKLLISFLVVNILFKI